MTRFGWIGLGNMGNPMAANLVKSGHTVRGFDVNPEAVKASSAHGVEPASSISDAVREADVVITMLPKGEHVRSVLADENGIWAYAPQQALLMDCSTVDVETSMWCHQESSARGFRFVDAPVSGGISGASAGTLAFMLGGTDEDTLEGQEHVQPMARKAFRAGGPTAGVSAKIANNMMLLISQMACSEGSQLAMSLGLDPKVFWDIVTASSGQSWAQQTWYPVPGVVHTSAANNNFEATFRADLALKDVSLALSAGEAAGLHLEAASLAREQLQRLGDEGLGDQDCSLVVKYVTPNQTQDQV